MSAHFGADLFGNPIEAARADCKLAADFIVPPFSVLNAREGSWQERKRQWLAMGIKGEVGRICEGSNAWNDLSTNPRLAESTRKIAAVGDGPTIFDPVLCELAYSWFSGPGAQIIDPFAGGSVRGIVASLLGRRYWGCDLRREQIEANEEQARTICPDAPPQWVCADAMDALPDAPEADLNFSCPPYGDLERYSDDPKDLSTMEYHTFIAAYRRIILRAAARLKDNRFAVFVVGDFRDKKTGHYRNFVGDTVESFRQCGMALYNEAILLTAIGSLPLRVGKQFTSGRKLGKTHQQVLVFVKGDWREAARACGDLRKEYELV